MLQGTLWFNDELTCLEQRQQFSPPYWELPFVPCPSVVSEVP